MPRSRGAGTVAKRPGSRRARGGTRGKKRRPKRAPATPAQRKRRRSVVATLGAVAAFLVAAMVFPLHFLGSRAAQWFPMENPVGALGERVNDLLRVGLGWGRFAAPLLVLAWAASIGEWWRARDRKGLWVLSVALLILVPVAAAVARASQSASGMLGGALGVPLVESVGWLGAWMLLLGAAVAASVLAFRFNPLRPPAAALVFVSRRLGKSLRGAARAPGGRRTGARKGRGRKRSTPGSDKRTKSSGPEIEPQSAGDRGSADTNGSAASPVSAASSSKEGGGTGAPRVIPEGAVLPPMDLLAPPQGNRRMGMERELDRLSSVLADTLQVFKIDCRITGRTTGPAVTQYEVVPGAGVKVSRIANLDADLALAMKAKSVRIVAPIPGKGAVGVEIPNPTPEIVRLREILEAPVFTRPTDLLPLGLGKDLAGQPFVADLAKMPHALIAGATGSGKSVCLNTIITSLVYRHGPDRLRLLLIDPKMVELSAYADLPHLRHPVVTDPGDAAGVLKWAVLEMERRYGLLSANGVRSLVEFNRRLAGGRVMKRPSGDGAEGGAGAYEGGPLPWIVVVVDELADLMMTVQTEVEKPLTQLAQKARAIGIHLLVATQRPSVNVITGLIKANFPCRIAFRVASKTDSRTILDQNGADSLLGSGDMLFLPPGQGEPVRMQGAFISTEETEALMDWFGRNRAAMAGLLAKSGGTERDILEVVGEAAAKAEEAAGDALGGDWDALFREAAEVCVQQGSGSTSLLQRRLRIGYGRAARIVDQLHDAGVLGPPDGSKPREVLLSAAALDEVCPG